jgi:ABC-type nickel/cobalt efflux system permease component RcnA
MEPTQPKPRTRSTLVACLVMLAGGMVGVVGTAVVCLFALSADQLADGGVTVTAALVGTAVAWGCAFLARARYDRSCAAPSRDACAPDMAAHAA